MQKSYVWREWEGNHTWIFIKLLGLDPLFMASTGHLLAWTWTSRSSSHALKVGRSDPGPLSSFLHGGVGERLGNESESDKPSIVASFTQAFTRTSKMQVTSDANRTFDLFHLYI